MKISNARWTRPSGPPIVWRTIDAKEKLDENTFADVRLSIQDIPEERYEEAVNHMCQYYLADEAMNKCLKIKTDLDGVNDNRFIWNCCLKQGMSIGAFKLNSSGKLEELIGVIILIVSSNEYQKQLDEILMNLNSSGVRKFINFVIEMAGQIDICKIYGVEKYIHEGGMSVKPTFRGQKLGVYLLEVWTEIGRKYGISVGSANFSTPMSQIQAERAGFKTLLTVNYSEVLDENGQAVFPNIASEKFIVAVKLL